MAKPKKTKTKKAIKKKFYPVEIPILKKHVELIGTSIGALNGRNITLDLTRDLRGKSLEMKLKVKVEGEKAIAEPVQLRLLGFFIRRMMRKGTDYVEDSFKTTCKDQEIIIKPFLIARRKVSRAVRKALRDAAKKELIDYVKDKKFEDIILEITGNRLQRALSLKLKKIYPLALCEIRFLGKSEK